MIPHFNANELWYAFAPYMFIFKTTFDLIWGDTCTIFISPIALRQLVSFDLYDKHTIVKITNTRYTCMSQYISDKMRYISLGHKPVIVDFIAM